MAYIITSYLKNLWTKLGPLLTNTESKKQEDYTQSFKIHKIYYDIKTWYNMQKENHVDDLYIKSTIYNNNKPEWLIRYDLSSFNYKKIHIYNIPPEMKFEILYNVINDKIHDHLLHGDGGNYIYSTFIEVCENIPDLFDLDFNHIYIWLTPCKYIIKPTIRHNAIIGFDVLNLSNDSDILPTIAIDLSKCHNMTYSYYSAGDDINVISLPFDVYIKKHIMPKIIL